jgi:hypothetical protein
MMQTSGTLSRSERLILFLLRRGYPEDFAARVLRLSSEQVKLIGDRLASLGLLEKREAQNEASGKLK